MFSHRKGISVACHSLVPYLATRQSALLQKNKTSKRVLPFVTTYQPSVRHLKKILMLNWDLIQNQPLLNTIFRNPPIIAYKRGTSFKDMLVRAEL